jgi:hypothetical protein
MIVWIGLVAMVLVGVAIGGGLYWIDQQDIEDGDTDDADGETDDEDDDDEADDGTDWLVTAQQYIDRGREFATRAWAYKPDNMAARSLDAAAGNETKRARWRMVGAVAIVLGTIVAMTYVAGALNGTLAGVAFIGTVVLGAVGLPVAIVALREGLPNITAIGLAIAGQIALGKAALVRRDDGRYEWTVLRESDAGFTAELDDGRTVPIDAEAGDLYAFGFGRLAVVEQKTDANLSRWTVADAHADGGTETRAGFEIVPPQREDGGRLVSLTTIQRAVRGSSSSTLVDRGHDKALDEEGGEQGVSQLWTMAFATVLLIVGFGMTFVALSL